MRLGLLAALLAAVTSGSAGAAVPPADEGAAARATGSGAAGASGGAGAANAGGAPGGSSTSSAPARRAKLPVPPEQGQAAAQKAIRGVYEAEYASRKPDELVALSDKLLEAAGQEGVAPVERFVLLREAGSLAASAGDGARAVEAAESLAEAFLVKSLATKLALVQTATRGAGIRDAGRAKGTAEAALGLVSDAVAVGDFDSATRAAAAAESVAKHADDAAFATSVANRSAEVRRLRGEHAKLVAVFDRLRQDPDDPAANLKVGRFYALGVGDWAKGLAHLAKGSDPTLQALAAKERANPQDLAARIAIADGWWDLAKREPAATAERVKAHAADWYRQAEKDARGVTLAKVQQRLAVVGPDAGVPQGRTLNLLRMMKLPRDAVAGKWQFVRGGVQSDAGVCSRIGFAYEPPEEYDLTIEFTLSQGQGNATAVLPRSNKEGTHVFGVWGTLLGVQPNPPVEGPSYKRVQKAPRMGDRLRLQLKVRKDRITGYANGSMFFDVPTGLLDAGATGSYPLATPERIGIGSDQTVVVFHRVELREVSGPGKKVK